MTNIEELYSVLRRNEQLDNVVFNVMVNMGNFNPSTGDWVEWVKQNKPVEYAEALKVVNDPNRKIVHIYEDEMEHFAMKYNTLDYENGCFFNLINDFLHEHELRDKFIKFLKENEDNEYADYGDIEQQIKDFS